LLAYASQQEAEHEQAKASAAAGGDGTADHGRAGGGATAGGGGTAEHGRAKANAAAGGDGTAEHKRAQANAAAGGDGTAEQGGSMKQQCHVRVLENLGCQVKPDCAPYTLLHAWEVIHWFSKKVSKDGQEKIDTAKLCEDFPDVEWVPAERVKAFRALLKAKIKEERINTLLSKLETATMLDPDLAQELHELQAVVEEGKKAELAGDARCDQGCTLHAVLTLLAAPDSLCCVLNPCFWLQHVVPVT
jgi:hypothetical protein